MRKLPTIFDDLGVPGIVVECSSHQAKRFDAFTEDYVLGRVAAEEATQKALALTKAGLS